MCLALPGEVLTIELRDGLAFGRVRFGSATREVCLAYVPEAIVGDWVIVHVGFAIQRLDAEAARASLALFDAALGGEIDARDRGVGS
jgi:hydrogenase expression/formation protein HypC